MHTVESSLPDTFHPPGRPQGLARVGILEESCWELPGPRRGWMRLKTLYTGRQKKPTLAVALGEGELVRDAVFSATLSTPTQKCRGEGHPTRLAMTIQDNLPLKALPRPVGRAQSGPYEWFASGKDK